MNEIQTCPKCGGRINPEHVRTRRLPGFRRGIPGRPWLVRAWCEHCSILITVRIYREGPDRVDIQRETLAARAFEKAVTGLAKRT